MKNKCPSPPEPPPLPEPPDDPGGVGVGVSGGEVFAAGGSVIGTRSPAVMSKMRASARRRCSAMKAASGRLTWHRSSTYAAAAWPPAAVGTEKKLVNAALLRIF